MPRKPIKTTKRLSVKSINQILQALDSWRGPLTWNLLLEVVDSLLGHRYTRQALWMHENIRLAFIMRKAIAAGQEGTPPRGSLGIVAAQERVASLKAKVTRLEDENQKLKVQFIRWAHNANKRGLDEAFLNQALPFIDREKSKAGATRNG